MFHAPVRDIRVVKRYERRHPLGRSMITTVEVAEFDQLTPAQADLLWTRSSSGIAAKAHARRNRVEAVIDWLTGTSASSAGAFKVAVNPYSPAYGWWAIEAGPRADRSETT
jgi:hypothetical protein